ncbi:MAG: serine/threonine protein kinase [Leptolyngbya sp.]|nr:MAG: serine/threonine protein kinase [Leptolyngbya sp.]
MFHQPDDVIRDRYRIIQFLGQGGMGTTYAAEDRTTGKAVAIKILSLHQLTNWKALELFGREAKVLENLNHPAIPAYLDHFQIDLPQDRLFYLVQELAEGESLAQWVAQGYRVMESEVKAIAIQILEILIYLHQLRPPVIHRDIKPQNIIRRSDGHLFLVDFGGVQAVYRKNLTWGSTVVGTFGYMPPEQFRGKADFGSDLYALGATLLFLLTHQSPADLPQKRMKILFRDQVAVSEGFANWLERMLEPDIEDRFPSAKEALQALRNRAAMTLVRRSSTGLTQQHKPKGSQIRLQRNNDWLKIEIPPPAWRHPGVGVGTCFAALLASVPVSFWIWLFGGVALTPGVNFWGVILFVLLPVFIFELSLIVWVITTLISSSRLEIDRQRFQIDWFQIGFGRLVFRYQHQGKTPGLQVNVETYSGLLRLNEETSVILRNGGTQRNFGECLTKEEKEWLAAEISDFLQKVQE